MAIGKKIYVLALLIVVVLVVVIVSLTIRRIQEQSADIAEQPTDGALENMPAPAVPADQKQTVVLSCYVPDLVFRCDFEAGDILGWEGRVGSEKLEVTDETSKSGNRSLRITERKGSFHGLTVDVLDKMLPNKWYDVSLWVKLLPGLNPAQITLNAQRTQNGTNTFDSIVTGATVTSDEWVLLTGTYRVDEGVEGLRFIIETTSGKASFYIDDFILKPFDELSIPRQNPISAVGKLPPNGNPLISHRFGADPHALVFNDRVYIFMTNDVLEYDDNGNVANNSFSQINKILVISSDDLMNWTDHGEIYVAGPQGAARWANNSWAPAIIHRVIDGEDRFFLYYSNNANGIGVLTSNNPLGPWVDPINRPLISRTTPGVEGVVWLFDPAVLVDDDNAYIYFGGGVPEGHEAMPNTGRVMRLGDDMISVVGEAYTIPAPFMFEASGINKYNGMYHYTYSTNFYTGTRSEGSPQAGVIAHMISDSPMGPWQYTGMILRNPWHFFGVGGNNHHNIFRFQDAWYIAYHAQTVAEPLGIARGYRSPHLNKVFFKDGLIQEIHADLKGVSQLKNFCPFRRVEAETFAWNAGVLTKFIENSNSQRRALTQINSGDWVALSGVDFGDGDAFAFTAAISNIKANSIIELRLGSADGELIGVVQISSDDSVQTDWFEVTTEVSDVSGVHDLFMVFKGIPNVDLFDFDFWQFSRR